MATYGEKPCSCIISQFEKPLYRESNRHLRLCVSKTSLRSTLSCSLLLLIHFSPSCFPASTTGFSPFPPAPQPHASFLLPLLHLQFLACGCNPFKEPQGCRLGSCTKLGATRHLRLTAITCAKQAAEPAGKEAEAAVIQRERRQIRREQPGVASSRASGVMEWLPSSWHAEGGIAACQMRRPALLHRQVCDWGH